VPTALLSVYDKTGIVELAAGLHDLGWSLLSSGGTARALVEGGLPVTDVASLTGMPAILGHRVVTLHPKVHGGLLADVDDPSHLADLERYGIEPIGLLVANLYPFSADPSVELIDVGGPAMVRAAAKNHAHVGVVVDPAHYDHVLHELRAGGALSSAYDAAIVSWFDATDEQTDGALPPTLHLAIELAQPLRYGENPHQQGARYRSTSGQSWWDRATQHGGKELSYLNVFDTEAAWRLVHRFDDPAVVIVKHANPCGVAIAADITTAYERANACDPVSAFGGIVAANRAVPNELADALTRVFTEVLVAPGFDDDALATLAQKANLRVLEAPTPGVAAFDLRTIDGGFLVQQPDLVSADRSSWQVVSQTPPTAEQWDEIVFAWTVCAAVSSNAIVISRDAQAVGIGAGQQNRLDSARIAVEKAGDRAKGSASDAFFPFRDGLDALAAAGVRCVVQPGGSVRDRDVIDAADEHGIAMVFTGERHFRH
jgi:phosphoribosylaminoimidazolecarboxamide formyltransferase / IMP cyclohydrolase